MATPPPPAATAPTPGARVYVGKLPRDVRKEDIEGLFKGYGVSFVRRVKSRVVYELRELTNLPISHSLAGLGYQVDGNLWIL